MREVYLIAGMAIVTFSIRYLLLAISNRVKLSAQLIQALRYIPPAVLTAIIVPATLIPSGEEIILSYTNARLIGAIMAVIVSWYSKNLLLTILVGMLTFFAWQWLLI